MASETKSRVLKVKKGSVNQDGPSWKIKIHSSVNKKKLVEFSIKPSASLKNISTAIVTQTEVKARSSSKTTTKTTPVRDKKVYSLPGQKYEIPEEREPVRIFYESLSKQIPSSEMAEFWKTFHTFTASEMMKGEGLYILNYNQASMMMEHGLLPPEKSKKAHEMKQRRQKQIRTGTPIKSPLSPSSSKPENSKKTAISIKKW